MKYIVYWVEDYRLIVNAKDEKEALEKAKDRFSEGEQIEAYSFKAERYSK